MVRPALFVLACSLCTLASAADGRFEKVLYAKGGATPTCLEWKAGGEQPVVALDYGPRTATPGVRSPCPACASASRNEVGPDRARRTSWN